MGTRANQHPYSEAKVNNLIKCICMHICVGDDSIDYTYHHNHTLN